MTARSLHLLLVSLVAAGAAGCGGDPAFRDPDAVVAAFVAAVGAPDRTMHLDTTGRLVTTMFEATLESAYDLDGSDFSGHGTVRAPALGAEGTVTTDVASIGGTTLIRFAGLDWSDDVAGAPAPLGGIAASDVRIAGTERRDGVEVLHLVVTNETTLAGLLTTTGHSGLMRASNLSGSLDAYVLGSGVPVALRASIEGAFPLDSGGSFTVVLSTTISGWGTPITIDAPEGMTTFPAGTRFVADNGFDEAIIVRDAGGTDLLVAACGRAVTADFDGTAFTIRFASDDGPILSAEPAGEPYGYAYVDATNTSIGPKPPSIEPSRPPCRGRL